jgi:SAM-dependent methyltransferase
MTDSPQVWHYGLMAEYWARFKTDAPEAPFFIDCVRRYGQPALDLGCGTGRILLPLLRAGLDADGCDVSPDMLRWAQRAADEARFSPRLFAQAMHQLDLPRRYRTILICGSFGLGGTRETDLACLRCCHAHLEPGGALVFNVGIEYASAAWDLWRTSSALPAPWPERGPPRIAADGSEHFMQIRAVAADPLTQTYTREVRLEKWQSGKLVAAESYRLKESMYLREEVLLMLKVAGFERVLVQGDFTNEEATAKHQELVFTAVRT